MTAEVDRFFDMTIEQLTLEVVTASTPKLGKSAEASVKDQIKRHAKAIKESIQKFISENRDRLYKSLCVDLKYCKIIKSDRTNMVMALVDAGIIAAAQLVVPPVMLAVYIIRLGYLDQLCECAKNP